MRKIILDPPAKEVGSKNRNPKDLVTSCDIQIQEILRQKLTALLPEASFLGEEGSTDTAGTDIVLSAIRSTAPSTL